MRAQRAAPPAAAADARRRLRLDEMISLRLDPDRINEGYEAMLAGEVVRSIVEFA